MNGSIKKTNHIALPWVLGLYALGGTTFVIATVMARWYGGPQSTFFLLPFVAVFGGLAQFMAGMWAYAADDVLGTAMLGTWGSFWMAYGLLNGLFVWGKLTAPQGAFPELAFWLVAVAAITWIGAVAATQASAVLVGVFGTFAIASTLGAIATGFGLHALSVLAGWVFVIGSVVAWYAASAMLLNEMFDREMLPVGWRIEASTRPRSAPAQVAESIAARRVS
jgi:succinate-acetate transporter protein